MALSASSRSCHCRDSSLLLQGAAHPAALGIAGVVCFLKRCGWCSIHTCCGVILASAAFGLFVGAVPGLTATMATALLVPVTFFLPPIPAIATMVTATSIAIFAGDIPAPAAHPRHARVRGLYGRTYRMTRNGQAELALGASLMSSAFGGLFGTAVLMVGARRLPSSPSSSPRSSISGSCCWG